MASPLSRELVFLILQFLDDENYRETAHWLERESGFFFNMRYFEVMVTNGEWDEAEKYVSGYTKMEDNRFSMKMFFEMKKQKYLEALDRKEGAKALEILQRDLKMFSAHNEDLFKDMTLLLTLDNFRENALLSTYGDTNSARGVMLAELKKLIEANPVFHDKLNFPSLKSTRLRTLINHSLNWQHQLCKHPKPHPEVKTLFVDHNCGPPQSSQPSSAYAPSLVTNPLLGAVSRPPAGFPPLGAPFPFPPAPGHLPPNFTGWMANPAVARASASSGPIGLVPPNIPGLLKRSRTPPAESPAVDYQTADSEHVPKRIRASGTSDEV